MRRVIISIDPLCFHHNPECFSIFEYFHFLLDIRFIQPCTKVLEQFSHHHDRLPLEHSYRVFTMFNPAEIAIFVFLALPTQVFSLDFEAGLSHTSHKLAARADPGCPQLPVSSGGRKIGLVIDSSGSNYYTDPSNLRIAAAKELNSLLITKDQAGSSGHSDLVTVIDFDSYARVISPLGDPAHATFDGIDSEGGTYIADGIRVAIDELTNSTSGSTAHQTGVVVLTDGEDYSVDELLNQLTRARNESIRVAFGFLSPEAPAGEEDLLTAILKTGGIYSTISSAEAQKNFVNLVIAHGLTDIDNTSSANGTTILYPGLSIAGNVSAASGPKTYTYSAQAGEKLNFSVKAISGQKLDLTLRDTKSNKDLNTTVTDSSGNGGFLFDVTKATELGMDINTTNKTSGLFTIGFNSSVNRTYGSCRPSKTK